MDPLLSDKTEAAAEVQIAHQGQLSTSRPLLFGVPRGFVLGPLLYVLYTVELCHLAARHGTTLQQKSRS